jgi:hypothetical protein
VNRAVIATVGLACAAAAVPALADPAPVDSGRAANTTVSVRLPDAGTLTLDILAAELSAGPRLSIRTQRCDEDDACTTRVFSATPSAGALSIDPQTAVAHLATTLDGRPLVIRWRPGNGAELGSGYVDGGGTGFSGSNFIGAAAEVTVDYDGGTCTGGGGVGQAAAIDVDPSGSGTTAPLDRLRLPDGVTLRC